MNLRGKTAQVHGHVFKGKEMKVCKRKPERILMPRMIVSLRLPPAEKRKARRLWHGEFIPIHKFDFLLYHTGMIRLLTVVLQCFWPVLRRVRFYFGLHSGGKL